MRQPLADFIKESNIEEFDMTERLSKRLARMGVCSRRSAEKLMAQGMVRVDGNKVTENMLVNSSNRI